MGILQRFTDIIRSNINSLLDTAEDPAKMIDQTLADLREDLAEVKLETANVMADEKAAKRNLDECNETIQKYQKAAENALKAGNEGDARKLIARMQNYQATLPTLQETYDLAKGNSEKMRQMYDKLSSDIEALEARKDAIKGKVAAAKAQKRMNQMTSGGVKSTASLAAFDRMEQKADKLLDSAMAEAELDDGSHGTKDLVDKYASDSSSVDDELAAMKAKLGL